MGWGKLSFLLTLILPTFAWSAATPYASTKPAGMNAVVIKIDGQINDYTRDTLAKRLADTRKLKADTVILQIDTYGGAVTSALEITAMLKRSDDLHVIAYVPEKAISAGAMIALAANEIVMGPVAKIGDAAPIAVIPGVGLQPLPAAERAKAESPVLEDFRHSAYRNGYDPLLAESMVSVGKTVYWIEHNTDGRRRFVEQAEYDKLTATPEWYAIPGVRNPIDSADELLTVSTDLAVKLGLAKGVAADAVSLAAQRDLKILATFETGLGEKVLGWLNSLPIRFVLFVVFLLSLYIALHSPGMGGAEAVAAFALGCLLVVPWMTGYAQWWEVVAIVLGLALLAIEIFVIPGFGLAGISGIVLLMFGFLMTFVPKEPDGLPGFLPSMASTWAAIQSGLIVVVGGMICSLLLAWWLRKYMPKLPFFGRMILTTPTGETIDAGAMETTAWPAVGDQGEAATDLRPGGSGKFLDPATGGQRLVSVVSDRGFVRVGSSIVVQEVSGGRVVVRETKDEGRRMKMA